MNNDVEFGLEFRVKLQTTQVYFFKIEMQFIHNVLIVSGVQQSDSVTYIYMCVCVCVCVYKMIAPLKKKYDRPRQHIKKHVRVGP